MAAAPPGLRLPQQHGPGTACGCCRALTPGTTPPASLAKSRCGAGAGAGSALRAPRAAPRSHLGLHRAAVAQVCVQWRVASLLLALLLARRTLMHPRTSSRSWRSAWMPASSTSCEFGPPRARHVASQAVAHAQMRPRPPQHARLRGVHVRKAHARWCGGAARASVGISARCVASGDTLGTIPTLPRAQGVWQEGSGGRWPGPHPARHQRPGQGPVRHPHRLSHGRHDVLCQCRGRAVHDRCAGHAGAWRMSW